MRCDGHTCNRSQKMFRIRTLAVLIQFSYLALVPLCSADEEHDAIRELEKLGGVFTDGHSGEVTPNKHAAWADLDKRELDANSLAPIRKLTHLQELQLRTTDAGLENLEGLKELRKLRLVFSFNVTDSGLEHVSGLKGLEVLWLNDDEMISDAGLEYIGRLTGLRDLSLASTNVS